MFRMGDGYPAASDVIVGGVTQVPRPALERARRTAVRLEQEIAEEQERVRLLNVQVRLLEVQRRGMLALLDSWEIRMGRIREGGLIRSALAAIEECRREVSRLIECGPPILPVDEEARARRTKWICE